MIINLVGAPEAGKTHASRIIQEAFNFERFSYAAALREEVEKFLCTGMIDGERPTYSLFVELNILTSKIHFQGWDKPKTPELRKLLQLWGTEFRRSQNPDYWVDKVILASAKSTDFVLDDPRFENEFAWNTGPIIYIYNSRAARKARDTGVNNHESEKIRLEIAQAFDMLSLNQMKKILSLHVTFNYMGHKLYYIENKGPGDLDFESNLITLVSRIIAEN